MNDPSTQCPNRGRLQALLGNSAPEDEQARLVSHLDLCGGCQSRLEEIATGDPDWSGTFRNIEDDAPPSGSAFWPAVRQLEETDPPVSSGADLSPDSPTVAAANGGAVSLALDFLRPAERPDTLGRLAHFDVVSIIGRGGMGVVLQGFDPCLQRGVALKVLDPQLADNELARKRFCREARAAASITHEYVVTVHQVEEDEDSGLPFLVMQHVVGESLEQYLRRVGRLPLPEIVRVAMQTAAGLAAAHAQGLIHRDIKPGNILMEKEGGRVKLTDFGLARVAEDVKLTQTGFVAGTPLYMSPEQARGEEMDHRADLFSFGVVLYELCTGTPPFDGTTPYLVLRRLAEEAHRPVRDVNPEIPEWLATVVDRLLEKNPADRYQSAAEVSELLAQQLGRLQPLSPLQVPVVSPSRSGLTPARRPGHRVGWTLGLGVAAVLGVLAVMEFTGPIHLLSSAFPGFNRFTGRGPDPVAVLTTKAGPIWSVAFSADGKTLAVALDDGHVRLWDVDSRSVQATIDAHHTPVWSLAFAPGSGLLATGSDDGTVKLWEPKTGKLVHSLKPGNSVRAVAFSPDGKLLVAGSRDGSVRLYGVAKGTETVAIKGHEGTVVAVAFSHDGKTVASGSGDKTIKLWNVTTGQLQQSLEDHLGGVYGVAFSPDGKTLASGGWDKVVRVWDLASGQVKHALKGHTQDVWAVAFSPDGRWLASSSEDRTVKVWDMSTGQEHATLSGHTGTIHAAAFSPDSQLLASGGRDGTVRLWDTK